MLETYEILAHYAVAQSIFQAYALGLWRPFEEDLEARVSRESLLADGPIRDRRYADGLLDHLVQRGFLAERDSMISLSDNGRELIEAGWLGYFVFYVGGYGDVLARAAALARGEVRYGRDLSRDGRLVALGSELIGQSPHHRSYEAVLERAAALQPRAVLDVGCGSGAFLSRLVGSTGAQRAIGIDISEGACDLARARLGGSDHPDRFRVLCADARRALDLDPSLLGSVDVVTAMFILHEFLSAGSSAAAAELGQLARILTPVTGRLLVLEKHTDALTARPGLPYLPEFKLSQDLSDQVICSRREWHSVFDAAGLDIVHERALAPHTGSILFECRAR